MSLDQIVPADGVGLSKSSATNRIGLSVLGIGKKK